MRSTLNYLNGHLCILNESEPGATRPEGAPNSTREWYAVREAAEAEVASLVGRPVTRVASEEGLYVDEEGNVFQLADKSETKPISVGPLAGEKPELETLLAASLKGGQTNGKNSGAHRLLKKNRSTSRKQQALEVVTAKPEARPAEAPSAVETNGPNFRCCIF